MELWRRNVYILWLAVFVAAICWTMVMPFMPVFLARDLGVPDHAELWTGIVSAAAAACNMVMSPVWGAVGDRYGRRLMMLRAGICLSLGYALLALVQGPFGLLAVRMMIGLLTGFVPMAVALVGVSTPQHAVGHAMGLVQTAWPAGAILGPVLGGVLSDLVGIRGASGVSAALIAGATALVTVTVREQFTPPPRGQGHLWRDLRVAAAHPAVFAIITITATSMASATALEPVLVPFIKAEVLAQGAPDWLAGTLYALPSLAFIALTPWWSRQGAQVGYPRTIAVGMVGAAAAHALLAVVTGPWQLAAVRLLAGVTGAAVGPGVAALLATAVPQELRGRAFGLNQAASSAGSILGPLLGGLVGSVAGPRAVFVLVAVIYLGGYVWVRRVVAHRVGVAVAG